MHTRGPNHPSESEARDGPSSVRRFDALLLDYGNVISISAFERQRENEAALGLAPGTLDWRGPIDPGGDPLWRQMSAGAISERDYWARRAAEVGRMLGHDAWTPLEFHQAIRGTDPNQVVREAARRTIRAARAAGLRVAVLSNELELFWGREFVDRLEVLRELDLLVDATHTGVLKPDPRAYRTVLEALGVAAPRALFVDDQLRNVEGARALGLDVVFFDIADPEGSFARVRARLGIDDHVHA